MIKFFIKMYLSMLIRSGCMNNESDCRTCLYYHKFGNCIPGEMIVRL
jgi:hypothetical protein